MWALIMQRTLVINKIALVIGLLGLCSQGKASESFLLNWTDRAIAYVLDQALPHTGYEFEETFLVVAIEGGKTYGPMSMGKALVLNEKLNRLVAARDFAATIQTKLKVNGEKAGELEIRWHPSQNFLAMAASVLMFRLDRAYPWPQFVLDLFPDWFDPKLKHEPFELHWFNVTDLLLVQRQPSELRFLDNVIREMQVLNPDVKEMLAAGLMTTYGDSATNKTIFIFEVETVFPGAMRCRQRVRSNYNPYTKDLGHVHGGVRCHWPELE